MAVENAPEPVHYPKTPVSEMHLVRALSHILHGITKGPGKLRGQADRRRSGKLHVKCPEYPTPASRLTKPAFSAAIKAMFVNEVDSAVHRVCIQVIGQHIFTHYGLLKMHTIAEKVAGNGADAAERMSILEKWWSGIGGYGRAVES